MAQGGTVEIPAVGRVDKRYVYAGVALVAGIAGYAWWRRSRSGAAPAGPSVPEPATGSDTGSDAYGNPDPHTSGGGSDAPGAPTNNIEWTTRAIAALTDVGIEPGYASLTLGKYLARVALDHDEQNVVRQAWALVGKPPDGAYSLTFPSSPPPPNPQPTPTPTPTPTPSPLPHPVPGLLPGPLLRLKAKTRTGVSMAWAGVPGASGYRLAVIGGVKGSQYYWDHWSIVVDHFKGTAYQFNKVHPGATYHFRAETYNSAGKIGNVGNTLGVVVPK